MPWLVAATLVVWLLCLAALFQVWRARGLVRRLKALLSAALWGMLGTLLASLVLVLTAFQAFSDETLVGRVTTRRLAAHEFELTYTPATSLGRDPLPLRVSLRGDQWSISGGIIKWHPWLTALGLNSYHKPLRLSGQFADLAQQRAAPPTVEPLDPSIDRLWEALYWADPLLPFVEAVYGSAAYAYVEPNATQEVYVTPSGYMIKRIRPAL